ncbi:hypothetical protein [Mesorhizobium sp.]|uniref:hypothetical protein n=1 Tax=Mesorhizobium sp. TaxID=1871066 RepID=UPI0011FB67F0|nr:hypothetical protein [Mesorhizobium sp.]TIN76742.1 MAG: hypothetical protein E5Y09_20840 [Mesorhizobium sp.]
MNAMRPCFLSQAQEREFEALVTYARCGIYACGEDHACGAVNAIVPLSHDVDAIIRCAKADIAIAQEEG